jgi:hypothetical protein
MSDRIKIVDDLFKKLQTQPFDKLNEMPSCKENKSFNKFSIAVWKDVLSDSELRIVVQGYQPGFLGIGKIYARGFRKTKSGEITSLTADEMAEFS